MIAVTAAENFTHTFLHMHFFSETNDEYHHNGKPGSFECVAFISEIASNNLQAQIKPA